LNLADLDVSEPDGPVAGERPHVEIGTGPATIRAVAEAIDSRKLPDVYVSDGHVVHVEQVSGSAAAEAGDDDSPLPVTASAVNAASLARLLAEHTYTYRIKTAATKDGDGKAVTTEYPEEATPAAQLLGAALAGKTWPGLHPLHGIAGAPVLRPDGTLLQDPGYDDATGLYLASKIPLNKVPAEPTAQQVEAARAFLLDEFLHDFPSCGG
jgi:hypothetical protein